jgi:hypothetical protein
MESSIHYGSDAVLIIDGVEYRDIIFPCPVDEAELDTDLACWHDTELEE